ncbi:protein FAM151B [Menidia menidia]
MADASLRYFWEQGRVSRMDAAEVSWTHAANSRARLMEALTGPCHMIEADVILRGCEPTEPVMAHPPDTDSDITLKEWLEGVREHKKGIKLDFKSLEAVAPSLPLLTELLAEQKLPVWINADVLRGPGGRARPLEPAAFLSAVAALPAHTVLSLGWTTGWTAGTDNPGYSWEEVHRMEEVCGSLPNPVTFPVRAALLAESFSQLSWLLQQSPRYTLTVWTGEKDDFALRDLRPYRQEFHLDRIYYDLPDPVRTQLGMASRHQSTDV